MIGYCTLHLLFFWAYSFDVGINFLEGSNVQMKDHKRKENLILQEPKE